MAGPLSICLHAFLAIQINAEKYQITRLLVFCISSGFRTWWNEAEHSCSG